VIRALLGDYGQQAPAETFLDHRDSIPNDVARLRGARFVAATELTEGRRLNEALVKRMSGGDAMVARFMRGEWFEFTMQGKVWLASNHLPTIRGTDEAIWRRIRLVEFGVTIPAEERDQHLAEKLRRELPGILNWAIEGCLAWQTNGLGNPDAVVQATAGYRDEMDVLGGFLADACVTTESAKAKASQLYDAYTSWAATNGERHPLTQQACWTPSHRTRFRADARHWRRSMVDRNRDQNGLRGYGVTLSTLKVWLNKAIVTLE